MKSIKSFSLGGKFIFNLSLSVLMICIVGFLVWSAMSKTSNNSEHVIKKIVPAVTISKTISSEMESFEKNYLLAILEKNNEVFFNDAVSHSDRAYDRLFGAIEAYESLGLDASDSLKIQFLADWKRFNESVNIYRDALADKNFKLADKGRIEFISPAFIKMKEILTTIDLNNANLIEKEALISGEVKIALNRAKQVLIIGLGFSFFIIILFSMLLISATTKGSMSVADKIELSIENAEITNSKLLTASNVLTKLSYEQSKLIQESTESIAKISSMISNTVESTKNSLVQTQNVQKRTEDGQAIMKKMSASMSSLNFANQDLQELIKVIDDIKVKTSIIDNIVIKSQMLSFNASIEAERAGEHGHGFAVVAYEVRALADICGRAAAEIDLLLNQSQDKVKNTLNIISGKIFDGTEVSEQAEQEFVAISSEVLKISLQVQSIKNATEEQENDIKQANQAISNIGVTADQIVTLSSDNLESADRLKKDTEMLQVAMSDLRMLILGHKIKNMQKQENFVDDLKSNDFKKVS